MSNEITKRLKKARENIAIFAGMAAAMSVSAVLMYAGTELSPGTYLATGLAGVFIGLMLASAKRVQQLEGRIAH
ncbi:MAG: hypothetical protein ACREBU_02225 [Nitrososphaera sp.]